MEQGGSLKIAIELSGAKAFNLSVPRAECQKTLQFLISGETIVIHVIDCKGYIFVA